MSMSAARDVPSYYRRKWLRSNLQASPINRGDGRIRLSIAHQKEAGAPNLILPILFPLTDDKPRGRKCRDLWDVKLEARREL